MKRNQVSTGNILDLTAFLELFFRFTSVLLVRLNSLILTLFFFPELDGAFGDGDFVDLDDFNPFAFVLIFGFFPLSFLCDFFFFLDTRFCGGVDLLDFNAVAGMNGSSGKNGKLSLEEWPD